MTRRLLPCLVAALVSLLTPAAPAAPPTPAGDPTLTTGDGKFLDGLVHDFLFDPRGAERVRVKAVRRLAWGGEEEVEREGWLVPAAAGRAARVHFTDGETMPAPAEKDQRKRDFLADCRALLARPERSLGQEERLQAGFERRRQSAAGAVEEPDLVRAAWLHRLGHDDLAARFLARAGKDRNAAVAALRGDLAWSAYAGMVHAFMVRADDEAVAHGERLLRLYAEEAKKYPQARAVLDDLGRRRKKGTFGRAPAATWPEGFDGGDVPRKVAYLVDALDEVDARQWGQPGGVDLASDRRVRALVDLGNPAVPALIDAVEKDGRLTRSVHFWRDFARSRTVLGVREAALAAVMSILRVRVFEPAATGDNFTARGEEGVKEVAARLRAYWREYGGLPFDARMMKVLTNPKARPEAWHEAAANLAALGERRTLATTVFSDRVQGGPARPNPAVARFRDPTAAEAILAAMDRDLGAFDAGPCDRLFDYERRHIEAAYLDALVLLGDRRTGPVLARRSRHADTAHMRFRWAIAAHWLGEGKPLEEFAEDFRAGKVKLPANDRKDVNDFEQPGTVELRDIIGDLSAALTPTCDRALFALAGPGHPYYDLVLLGLLNDNFQRIESHA